MLNNVKFLFVLSAVISIVGNVGIINKELYKASVMVHYLGLVLICIHSVIFLTWKVTLLIIIIDITSGYLSFRIFTSMRR